MHKVNDMQYDKMTSFEKRSALSLASIYAFRMLGLFMILPVFVFHANSLQGATPKLIGLAMGIYGLTQALLQIPFGMLSDRWGRKPVIAAGLVIFAIGSVIAALSHTIEGVILGRAIQGSGAVGSTLIALLADLTREEHRGKAMAMVGMVIGMSFSVSLVLGPLLNSLIGVAGIFWLTAALAGLGIVMLMLVVPHPTQSLFHRDALPEPRQFRAILRNQELLRLDLGILILHGILTASFVAIPVALQHLVALPAALQWRLYLPVILLAFITMIPFIIAAEKKGRLKEVLIGAISAIALAELGLLLFSATLVGVSLCLYVFFTAFTLLEATLPSLIAKVAPAGSKGTAMGVYSCSQFLGIFLGGVIGGWLFGTHHVGGVYLLCSLFALLWLLTAVGMKKPRPVGTFLLRVAVTSQQEAQQLTQQLLKIAGVEDAVVMVDDQTAYLKIDNSVINKEELKPFSV
jgi:MFS family permease